MGAASDGSQWWNTGDPSQQQRHRWLVNRFSTQQWHADATVKGIEAQHQRRGRARGVAGGDELGDIANCSTVDVHCSRIHWRIGQGR